VETILGRVSQWAEQTPDAVALCSGPRSVSYAELDRRATRLAQRLIAAGSGPEDRVIVAADRSAEAVIAILGILKSGAAYVPVDPAYPAELRRFMIEDSGARFAVLPQRDHEVLAAQQLETIVPDDLTPSSHPLLPAVGGDQLAYVIYTSGSTGQPKGVAITHANLAYSTSARIAFYGERPERFLLLSSFSFDSSVAGLFWTLASGGLLVLPPAGEERSPAAVAQQIEQHGITHTLCLPSFHALLLATHADLRSLRQVIVAGETCPTSLPREHADRVPGAHLYNEYGPTEATVWATAGRLLPDVEVTIGKPIPGTSVHILNSDGAPVAADEPGELCISGPGLAREYLNQPELTAQRFEWHPQIGARTYKTGDRCQLLPSGEIRFLGRIDRQVKIRGHRIEPEAIEAVIASHDSIQSVVVVAREEEPGDRRLVAYVAPQTCDIPAIRELIGLSLPGFMMPSAFVKLREMPVTPNGKIDRSALPPPDRADAQLVTDYVAASDSLEQFLVDEWCRVLHLDNVGVRDRFFDLGGDSLRAATLMHRIQERLGEPVFVVGIFEAPTIADLAAYLRKNYAAAVAREFGSEPEAPSSRGPLTEATITEVRRRIRRTTVTSKPQSRNRRAIFILAPPRSGTTLLKAMLAQHPGLFAASELRLLGFETVAARNAAFQGRESIWRHRLEAVLCEARHCTESEAEEVVRAFESNSRRTEEFYALIQEAVHPRELVEKTTSYALDPAALQHADSIFDQPFYIHLTRDPAAMIASFERQRMDQIYVPFPHDLTPRDAGELIWLIAHQNALEFLSTIPAERQHRLRFEQLVTAPEEVMRSLCSDMGIPFSPAVLDPYRNRSGSPNPEIPGVDDPNFLARSAIDPGVAWTSRDNHLAPQTAHLAAQLGYAKEPESSADDPIAIIGMSGRFPGANDIDAFWENLCAAVESIRPFTDEELRRSGVDSKIASSPGYVNAGAVMNGADTFDASFFGYTPREAELMDPQQRVFLECAWSALESAGYDVSRLDGAVGVYAGIALNSYFQNNIAPRADLAPLLGQYSLTVGNEKDFLATRVAHKLGLRGPAISVQTACSSSLVALHLACQSLRCREIDMAIVGGGRIRVPLHAGYVYIDGGIASPDGHCRAFDADARGCVAGSGMAAVVLKRLSDAQRDGDHIWCVVRGSAINNDGAAKVGFTAPGVDGQAAVIAAAHRRAGVRAESISYVEAHGTGTSLGDPIEVTALTKAFRQSSTATGFCRLGSVKTNIGHLDAGAGIAGVIKTALALHHECIPPSLHCKNPNPQIPWAETPFVVNTELSAWPRGDVPRRAGVSSFGIGGTNAHVVLEEAPERSTLTAETAPQVIVLSARSPAALEQAASNLAAYFRMHPELSLADAAHTLRAGRIAFSHRLSLVASDVASAAEVLESQRNFAFTAPDRAPPVVFMFPGQGAQFPGMGRELYDREPVFRDALDRCASLLMPDLDLLNALYGSPDNPKSLDDTAIAQPAIFSIEYATAALWKSWEINPTGFVGHSVGEYVAACLAGVFSLEEAIGLLQTRARLMQATGRGSMVAVRLSESELRNQLPGDLDLAAINSPSLCVVSGDASAVQEFVEGLGRRGIATAALRTSHAFHSRLMEPVTAQFADAARKVTFHPPEIPIYSTLSGELSTAVSSPDYWAEQLRSPVRFADAVAAVPQNHLLLEVGPGCSLGPLARQSRGGPVVSSQQSVRSGGERTALMDALGRLWAHGVPIEWSRIFPRGNRVPLPTYPFQRERFWLESVVPAGTPRATVVSNHARQAADANVELKHLLHELSGLPIDQLDERATLLELGFDSLFLTQLTLALQKRFGVSVAFRQLFDELSTIAKIAAFIEAAHGQHPSTLERATSQPERSTFGPFRPLELGSTASLDERQRQHLDELAVKYTSRTAKSKQLAQENRTHFADPRSVAGFRREWKEMVYPIAVATSSGSHLCDIDGNDYVDFTMGYGTNLFGHSPAFVKEAIAQQLESGMEIGPQSPLAGEVARLLCEFSGLDRATFCNTGSEAVLAALRLARTVSGRTRIATFGGYHGINDELLARAQTIDGVRRSVPIAPGVPEHVTREVLVLDYGSTESLELLRQHAPDLAAVIVEPVQSRHPALQPREFLHEVRRITATSGAALIFDEMITGFRCHPGGAQAWFGVRADLVTYGKIIGGGMPMGAVCGRANYMDALDGGAWNYGDASRPETGMTFFAGTYVRHPLALAASLATLSRLKEAGSTLQEALNQRTTRLVQELNSFLTREEAPIHVESFASMWIVKFDRDFAFGPLLFFHLRARGIHAWDNRLFFLSTAHEEADIARFESAFRESVLALKAAGFFNRAIVAPTDGSISLPLTKAQRGLVALARTSSDASRAYNESSALDLYGPLDLEALQCALTDLVDRHEALRCSIDVVNETQIVPPRGTVKPQLRIHAAEEIETALAEIRALQFDFARAPMLDARLLPVGPDHHLLILSFPHLVVNGPSLGVIFEELAILYASRVQNIPADLDAPLQLSDFVRWTEQQPSAEAEEFWCDQFSTAVPPLELPLDYPRPLQRSYRGAQESRRFSRELTTNLRSLGAARKSSLFMVLLTAFQVVVHRLSRQDAIATGVAFESPFRSTAGASHLVANTTNLLPLPSRIDQHTTFCDMLESQRRLVIDAREHQDYFVGDLIEKLGVPFDPARSPLLTTLFNFESGGFYREAADLTITHLLEGPHTNLRDTAKAELFLNVTELDGELLARCDYNSDLFTPDTIRRWLGQFETLLGAIITDPGTPVRKLPLLSASERQQILIEWNETARDFPNRPVGELFERQAARSPDAPAVTDSEETISYDELNRRADAVAHHLIDAGVVPGDFVGVPADRSIAFVENILGVLKCGAAYVPVDPGEPVHRRATIEGNCKLVLSSKRPAAFPAIDHHRRPDLCGTSAAYMIYTSGSTGIPKGVVVPHQGIARLVLNTNYISLDADDIVAFASNPAFDAATFEIWGALLNGAQLVITPRDVLLSPDRLGQHLAEHRVTTLFLTTSLFNQAVQAAPEIFRNLRTLLFGGEAADPSAVTRLLNAGAPQRLLNGYGPTETTTFATVHEVRTPGAERIPIGRPISNTTAYILDEEYAPAPIGVVGELFIGGPGVALGYHSNAELTKERFLDTPYGRLYRTGDLARWLPNGEIDFMGRIDQQVKLRGFRIEPGEIESALRDQPGVTSCAVIVDNTAGGEKQLVAYFTPNGSMPEEENLRAGLAKRLPSYMVPAAFVALDRLPLTPNGKLDIAALPRPAHVAHTGSVVAPPENSTHRHLIEIWEELLDRRPIGIRDHFFEIGGHSLLAARMLTLVEQRLGRLLSFNDLYEMPTIEHLADLLLEKAHAAAPASPVVPIHSGGVHTPFFFLHGDFVGGGFYCKTLARHLGDDRPFYALHPHGLHGDLPPYTIEEMAAARLADIRGIQPAGPYLLGGYCNGGLVAFEVARMLEAAGETVAHLFLLAANGANVEFAPLKRMASLRSRFAGENGETERLRFLRWHRRASLARNLQRYYARAAVDLFQHPPKEQFRRLWAKTRRVLRLNRLSQTPDPMVRHSCTACSAEPDDVSRIYHDALDAYVPSSYRGRVVLLWPEEEPTSSARGPMAGWLEICEDVRGFIVPGDHHLTIAADANLQVVAGIIRSYLEEDQPAVPQRVEANR
jgi:amino acid adenylation domain-containing protein